MWRPGNGLHCCIVVTELGDWRGGVEIPDVQLVVVATAGNLPVVWGPFQATNLQGRTWQVCLLLV